MSSTEPPRMPVIRTPDQRVRVFISSTMRELAAERTAVQEAVKRLHLIPVLFEQGARPHPPRDLYQAYLEQSHIFVGIYWESYGWVAPDMDISGLEDEYGSVRSQPKLIYRKEPSPERDERLSRFLREIADAGDVSYRVFSTPEELAAVVQEDLALLLAERFESSRRSSSAGVSPAAPLPERTTSLVGRELEVDEVGTLLTREGVALVTLTGVGGIGKTTVAIEAARSLQDRFRDGTRFVPLATIRDPAMLPSEIARVLAVREEEQRDVMDLLKEQLGELEILLVLDNFEQIIGAAAVVAELLNTPTRSKILVTSRAALHLRAEHEYPVQPLGVPRSDPAGGGLTQYAAVELFVERARLVRPDFALDDENASAVAEICARLDGLPLAIELAAARVRILPPEALLKRLTSSLEILTRGPRDLPERQQTLRGAIDWSFDLLDDDERDLFSRFSIFVGGASIDAIEEVCVSGEIDVFDQVFSLVDKNLLRSTQDLHGESRFSMLQTVQEYAREQLTARGEAAATAARHTDYFFDFARLGERELRGRDQRRWTQRLDLEHDNLIATLGWLDDQEDPDRFLEMFYALHKLWLVRGYLVAASSWGRRVLARADEASPRAAARGLFAAGAIAEAMGKEDVAESAWRRAFDICRSVGDVEGMATITNVFGRLAFQDGDIQEAQRLFAESLRLFSEIDDDEGVGQCLNNLGRVAAIRGDLDEALRLLTRALDLFQRLDHQQWIARVSLNIGSTHRNAGNTAEAAASIRESTRLWNELGGEWDLADCLEDWAATEVVRGNHAEAALILGAVEALRERLHAPQWAYEAQLLQPYWDKLREALGDEAFDDARREGRLLSLQAAVDRVVRA